MRLQLQRFSEDSHTAQVSTEKHHDLGLILRLGAATIGPCIELGGRWADDDVITLCELVFQCILTNTARLRLTGTKPVQPWAQL